jgi:hypothetical protein
MKRSTLKYLIDVLLFVDISSIAVIGLLLGFVIPKGRQFGQEKFFLGLHRHEWGDIHLYLSLFLLLLLVLHIWLNWSYVVQSTKRYFGDKWKKALWSFTCSWIIVILIGWMVVKF